jgi:hypothetical protein
MCIAVGKVSFDDCDMLTSSLGWTGVFVPSVPPASWIARFDEKSLGAMAIIGPVRPIAIHSNRGDHLLARGIITPIRRAGRSFHAPFPHVPWRSATLAPSAQYRGVYN